MFVWDVAKSIAIEMLKEQERKPVVREVKANRSTSIIDDRDVSVVSRKSYEFGYSGVVTSFVAICNKKFNLRLEWDNNSIRLEYDKVEEIKKYVKDFGTRTENSNYILFFSDLEFNFLCRITLEVENGLFSRIFIKVNPK